MDAAIEKQSSFAFEYMSKRKVWHVPSCLHRSPTFRPIGRECEETRAIDQSKCEGLIFVKRAMTCGK